MLNDILVIRKIREGSISAFEDLFRRYYEPLLWFSAGITGRADVAEEIVQDLFYILWRDRDKINIMISVKSYLYSSVRNMSLQYGRRERLGERYSDNRGEKVENNTPLNDLEYKELEKMAFAAMGKMPVRRADIFRMHRFEGLKYSEIAQKLNLSVKTVEAEMSKAIAEFRRLFEERKG